ncbi:MAG TPA: FixH family protein [Aggregatilineales bacterium]|nr:FixH family protein [Anaerolineales bacterium]HRE49165.1 FixH family protein [Aggregatilineales bacterium]
MGYLPRVEMAQRVRCIILFLFYLFIAGCRTSAQPTPTPSVDLRITLHPSALTVGKVDMVVTVTDAGGLPLAEGSVTITGDMSHAGMAKEIGFLSGGIKGVYNVPFEWTMGGDWFVDVVVKLPDGRTASERFTFTVTN